MNKKLTKRITITIDVIMYIIMLAQMLYVFTGNIIHEILGISLALCVICHLIIKRRWIASLFKRKISNISKLRIISDIVTFLLFITMLTLGLSSMGVSRFLFPWFTALGSSDLHRYLATAALTLSVIHGGMHCIIRTKKKKKAIFIVSLLSVVAAAFGLWLVPYMNRHFRKVEINYTEAVSGEKIEWKGNKPLTIYFSRIGNTDFEADVDAVSGASLLLADGNLTGNTQLLADMIKNAVGCETKAITLSGKKYPSSYNSTVMEAGQELADKARPEIEEINVSDYDSIILVYPLWYNTIPTPVATFLENTDLSGKNIYLIATQGSSGFGSSTDDIKKAAKGANVTEVGSIYCDDIPAARQLIGQYLDEINK